MRLSTRLKYPGVSTESGKYIVDEGAKNPGRRATGNQTTTLRPRGNESRQVQPAGGGLEKPTGRRPGRTSWPGCAPRSSGCAGSLQEEEALHRITANAKFAEPSRSKTKPRERSGGGRRGAAAALPTSAARAGATLAAEISKEHQNSAGPVDGWIRSVFSPRCAKSTEVRTNFLTGLSTPGPGAE